MSSPNSKMYFIYCEICNYKRVSDGTDIGDLHSIKRSPVQGHLPTYDRDGKIINERSVDKDGKIVPQPQVNLTTKYKCPKCGRLVRIKKVANNEKGLSL